MPFSFKSIRTQLIIYLSCFALFLMVKDRNLVIMKAIAVAVISALTLETAIIYLKNKTLQISESPIITGLIVGFVLASDQAWWKIALAALIAVISKYLIRIKDKHIFNPAAFGIFLTVILLGASTGWNGTYLWYILVPFGLYFTYKIKKLEVVYGYAAVSLVLFGAQALLHKVPLLDVFGYFSYFYIFIMVIEPKTGPAKVAGKYFFGAGIAALIFILTETGVKFDAELFSLLAMNAAVPLFNMVSFKKGGPP